MDTHSDCKTNLTEFLSQELLVIRWLKKDYTCGLVMMLCLSGSFDKSFNRFKC